ncbi:hypothetical protein [Mucisphaera calidilacus]|uniref:Asl1-like glycosyl hydrolase catalytic domain-containing protein n=1 Tax=Mucisphaera calidilacus TaxID=2527982 RepID=A0A518BWW2_9BACT|nr:hypothetical protein [Mucisphaera calidilacus]QDU71424.1 hypothetical protein Pan265_12740 [Mucisphaera calidilacus]
MRCLCHGLALITLLASTQSTLAQDKLFGVHWWNYENGTAGDGPVGGSSLETILTHSVPWWGAQHFAPLYQQATTQYNAEMITRVDYDWGQTVPAPTTMAASDWANSVLGVVDTLGDHANIWIIGNEPNVTVEGEGWVDNKIHPDDYAAIYNTVRNAIKAQRPDDLVLLAPPSPGAAGGVRWMSGNTYLQQSIEAVVDLGGDIDGFAIHAYGSPFTNNVDAIAAGFQSSYASQLNVIDNAGFKDAPVYITEWSRGTSTTGDLAANEAVTAQFITKALADLHEWNQTFGNHNIVSTTWFVNQGYGGWESQSLDWWRSQGNPEGDPNDMWTAMMNAAQYPAGIAGTLPDPFPGDLNDDGRTDADDIDLLIDNMGNPAFDLDGDRDADSDDLTYMVEVLLGTSFGDATLDGVVDLLDLSALAANFYKTGGWADGDFNGFGGVDLNDLSIIASNWGAGSNVPEPALLIPAAALALTRRR